MNQIINMIIRQVMNQLVRRGVNAGFDQASKMGRRKGQPECAEDQLSHQRPPQNDRLVAPVLSSASMTEAPVMMTPSIRSASA